MADELDFPPWDLGEVALIVVYPTDELSFLRANPTAVHRSFSPRGTWDTGFNWTYAVLTSTRCSAKSQAQTDIAGADPAVLLLRDLPKNSGAYIFGRGSCDLKPDVVFPTRIASRGHFCVYPNLLHRTWIIQDLSRRHIVVNDCRISSTVEDQAPPWRALQYDCLNRVVIGQSNTHPGVTLFIKPIWPDNSSCLQWAWADPSTPELAGLNLHSSVTPSTGTQSQISQLQQLSTPSTYCVLERRLLDNMELFYGQNLATAAMLAAEKFSSEREARAQFSWRKNLTHQHFLDVNDLCFLDHPYILTNCPFDTLPLADMILDEPLNDRATCVLLQGILSAIRKLFDKGIAHRAITSSNILVADLSTENPRFWLTGFSSAGPMSEDKAKEEHSADVDMAMRIIAETRGGPNYFEDPAANAIFTGFLRVLQFKPLSANEILDGFDQFTHGRVDFSFRWSYLKKVFSVEQFWFGDRAYYRKAELAPIVRALLAHEAERCQQAYERILRAKPSESLPSDVGEELLHWEEAQKLFCRLSGIEGIDFYPKLKPKRKRQAHRTQEFPIAIRITYHAPSKMWNLSQLVNAIRPTDLLEIGDPERCVEVGGDPKAEGLYVDLSTFQHACHLLGVSPPKPPESDFDPRASEFRSVNSHEGDLVLAEEKLLLGIAIFKRSSRTMRYGGTEYPEASALQLCTQRNFDNLHHGILQSRYPPQNLKELCQGELTQEYSESQYQSLTESEDLGYNSIAPFTWRRNARLKPGQGQPANLTEEWINEQTKRRRHHPTADIKPSKVVDGKLVPVNDGPNEAAYSSPSCSNIMTGETFSAVQIPLQHPIDLRQHLEEYLYNQQLPSIHEDTAAGNEVNILETPEMQSFRW